LGRIASPKAVKTALLAGSTGLIGSQLLQLLLEAPQYDKVIALTRRGITAHPKLVQVKVEFENIAEKVDGLVGTTMEKAGSKEEFHKVDFEYPYLLAKATQQKGARQFMLTSSLGANKKSSIYYNKVKGEIEEAVSAIGFETVHIFRPSLLLGQRSEKRSAEVAAKLFYKVFGFLIPGKYKAIESAKVATAMIYFASQNKSGNFIHESIELQSF
jgi:uncharacterized protein YbjT (DUF2867 family)